MNVTSWPMEKAFTYIRSYSVSPVLSTFLFLRQIASPARCRDLEEKFDKHSAQLSEIFLESVDPFLDALEQLVSSEIKDAYLVPRLERLTEAVYQKIGCLQNCIGFIDGTVLGIARPSARKLQRVAYNGPKRNQSLNYQEINTADGIIAHVYRSVKERRHERNLYVRSNIDETIPVLIDVNEKRYCIFGDYGYRRRWFSEIPY